MVAVRFNITAISCGRSLPTPGLGFPPYLIRDWKAAMGRFTILFEDRMPKP